MSKVQGAYRPRSVDRAVYAILAAVCITNGGYVVGPWYLHSDNEGARAPLIALFNNPQLVNIFGFILIGVGIALTYATASAGGSRKYTNVLSYSLLLAFLLRLYSFIGVVMTLESWRPPNYTSHAATVLITGAFWVWVKVNDRPV
jgi:hypothetical protein